MIDKETLRSMGIGAGLMGFALLIFMVVYIYKTTLEIQNLQLSNKLLKKQFHETA